jgi:hypothetical protein
VSQLESVRNEDLRVGDIISAWFGRKTITAIRPYTGPLSDIMFAIADYEPGYSGKPCGFSLERGGHTDRVKVAR